MDEAGFGAGAGRWTREEHVLFVRGLEMYGKGWKKIAVLIQTRSVVQVNSCPYLVSPIHNNHLPCFK